VTYAPETGTVNRLPFSGENYSMRVVQISDWILPVQIPAQIRTLGHLNFSLSLSLS